MNNSNIRRFTVQARSKALFILVVLVALANVTCAPAQSQATSTASQENSAKNCTITKSLPQGKGLVIAHASTGQILYRISNQYPKLVVNGTAYDGRYHRFAIGKDISITRPFFSTEFYVTVHRPKYGISDAE